MIECNCSLLKFFIFANQKANFHIVYYQPVGSIIFGLKFIILIGLYFCRECFVTLEEMEVAKKLKAAMSRTFNENGGVFWQGVGDEQLTIYIMNLVDEFITTDGRRLWGSLTTGRQPNLKKVNGLGQFVEEEVALESFEEKDDHDSSIYIMNDKVQVRFCAIFK